MIAVKLCRIHKSYIIIVYKDIIIYIIFELTSLSDICVEEVSRYLMCDK